MKMFGKWFGRNDQPQSPEDAQDNLSLAQSLESQESADSHCDTASDGEPSAVKAAEQVAENTVERLPGSAGEPEQAASSKGGLQGMWEAAKKLAMTPVDPWFEKVAEGLNKTRQNLVGQVADLFRLHGKIDEEFWEELEAILLTADVGVAATDRIMETLRKTVKTNDIREPGLLLGELKNVVGQILGVEPGTTEEQTPIAHLNIEKGRLNVVMMVGVNGTGKTTSTAKLANYYKSQGYKVLLAAADTFRAAAIDQLQVWADRIGVDLVRHQEGSDPAAVVFDAIAAGKARGADIVFIDTAGRLHNKSNLMEELRKIRRVAGRDLEGSPHEVLLVLDATTGQNALEQARVFHQVTELTGLVMCKLDGSGKGGIIIAIAQEFNIPVKYIGVGESVDDLREFVPQQYLDALFAGSESQESRT